MHAAAHIEPPTRAKRRRGLVAWSLVAGLALTFVLKTVFVSDQPSRLEETRVQLVERALDRVSAEWNSIVRRTFSAARSVAGARPVVDGMLALDDTDQGLVDPVLEPDHVAHGQLVELVGTHVSGREPHGHAHRNLGEGGDHLVDDWWVLSSVEGFGSARARGKHDRDDV